MDDLDRYGKLKSDIIALKEYIIGRYDIESNIYVDAVLTEMNDLLIGIERGQLFMPYKELRLSSTWSATDGAYDDDAKLREMIYKIQEDIYSIKKHIKVLAKYKLFSHRKINDINWLFPNLDCKIGNIQCKTYNKENMLVIEFPNGYEIDLGFLDNTYIITIVKDDNQKNKIEEYHIKSRSKIEENLQALIYKYESM